MRAQTVSSRSPVAAIAVSLVVGLALAIFAMLALAHDGSEPLITGSVLFAFGFGWALMAYLTIRFSGQPQRWMYVPAAVLGGIGLVLVVLQPGPPAMDLLGWVWPIVIGVLAVWMLLQVRRGFRSRGRWLVVPVIGALLVMAVLGGLTTVGTAMTASEPDQSGRLVDIGGRRLYLECQGWGAPTVILQAGLGGSSESWARIQPSIAPATTVCAYDRAGRGRSDDPPGPQDGIALATDLHDLLSKAGIAGPYVLAAHSSGASYVRVFTAQYPDEVVGMVLLDPQPANAFTALPDYPGIYDYLRLTAGIAPSLARLGLLGPLFGVSPTEASADVARSTRDELRNLPTVLAQAEGLTSIGDRPLIVVSAGTGSQRGWAEAQAAQALLSTNAVHRTIDRGTHESVIEGDDATASAQAILDVVTADRDGTPVH